MSREYEEMQVEKWVNLEDVAEHLSISQTSLKYLKLMNGSVKEKFKIELRVK